MGQGLWRVHEHMTSLVHYLAGSEHHEARGRLAPLCGNAAMRWIGEDGFTYRWEAVNCQWCLAKRPRATSLRADTCLDADTGLGRGFDPGDPATVTNASGKEWKNTESLCEEVAARGMGALDFLVSLCVCLNA